MQIVGSVKSPFKLFLPENSMPESWDGVLCYKVRDDYLGVAEFTAPEGCIVVPQQLLDKYGLKIGDDLKIENVTLPKGTRITLKAQDSLDWKHVLEQHLPQHYTALQEGQELTIEYNGSHKISVVKCEPQSAICIIDTDLDLELDAPDASPSQSVVYDSTIPLSETALVIDKPGTITVDGLAFCGPVNATSKDSYLHRVVDDSFEVSEEVAICGEGSIVLNRSSPSAQHVSTPSSSSSGTVTCSTCQKQVPAQSIVPHQAFCARNTVKCTCCATFHQRIPENHWHCDSCGHSETSNYQSSHIKEHEYSICACGYKSLFVDVARHKATDCPQKLHLCQFCHLLLPQGQESPVNRIQGYSEHEASCGSKTVECPQCSKVLMVRNLQSHLLHHEQVRKDRSIVSPTLCTNPNCPNLTASPGSSPDETRLGLCDSCYGIVYVTQHDPDQSKLRARIERRYMIQLTRGCGNSWCANPKCASGTGAKRSIKEATEASKFLVEQPQVWLCVDKTTSRRALFLSDAPDFSREWKGMAITVCSSESDAKTWLNNNAPRVDGT